MTRRNKLLVLLIIPTAIMWALIGLLIGISPRGFLWLRCIAGIWTLIYAITFRCKTYGYKGITSVLVFVFLAATIILAYWLVPFEIVDKSLLLIVFVVGIVIVFWDHLRTV